MRPHNHPPYPSYDGAFYAREDQHHNLVHQLPSYGYPLRGIPHPHAHDVLCGRGGQSNTHPGNLQWRTLVAANKELYVSLPKKQKMLLSQSIVNAVRSQQPPGRFLQKDPSSEQWYDVGDKRAQEKTSQALREGAPEIRNKLKGKKGGKGKAKEEEEDEAVPPQITSIERNTSREQMPPPVTYSNPTSSMDRKPPPIEKLKSPEEEEAPPPPPPKTETDFSFGSIALMSDAEQARLMNVPQPPPVDSGLDQPGFSFGSMMSIGTTNAPGQKLERAGLSVGSAMSYTVGDNTRSVSGQNHRRDDSFGVAPDLTDIGTSFGSLSINPGEREQIIREAHSEMEVAAAPPTFLKAEKSRGNLLECSDSEEEIESDLVAQKSANWERLQATIAAQDMHSQVSTSIPLPQSTFMHNTEPPMTSVPVTDSVSRNFSNMSAISVTDDFEPHQYPINSQPLDNGGGYYNCGSAIYSHPSGDMPVPPPMKKGHNDGCWGDLRNQYGSGYGDR